MLLFLNSRQFVSLLLECEAGFYWKILKSSGSELSVLHVDLPLSLKESCVTLSHVNHASLRALGLPRFPRELYPIIKCSRSRQTVIQRRGKRRGPRGRINRESLFALLPHGRLGGETHRSGALPAERGRRRGAPGAPGRAGPGEGTAAAAPAPLTWAAPPLPSLRGG